MPRPTRDQIEEQHNLALEQIAKCRSRYPEMTFEEGVDETILWMNGDSDDPPMEEE